MIKKYVIKEFSVCSRQGDKLIMNAKLFNDYSVKIKDHMISNNVFNAQYIINI